MNLPPKVILTGPDSSVHKHNDHHEARGHTTKTCLSLKFFIEVQVKKYYMNQYVSRGTSEKGEGFGK